MEQHTPTPAKPAPQRIVRSGRGKGWGSWAGGAWLLAILIYALFYLPTQGPPKQRLVLGSVFLVLGLLILCLDLLWLAKRHSLLPGLPSLLGIGAVLGLVGDWSARAGLILCVVALDASLLLWARSRHP